MRYLSLFSGIEAASVAWKPMGWECVGVAEIEPFPSAVLKHHYPDVPNLGDITKITQQQIKNLGKIDVVVGGFPCQDLSVAGQRKGLKNADGTLTRSGLFFTACQIVEWAAPRWTIIENVPGLFSSNAGGDFASVVGELVGAEIGIPRDGWRNAGVALGHKGLVEWATLDAQYVRVESHPRAVPQRRRRVFVIRDSGNWSSRPSVLFERESLCGHPAPRRETREGVTHPLAARTRGGGGLGSDFDIDGGVIRCGEIAPTLNAAFGEKQGLEDQHINGGCGMFVMSSGQANAAIAKDIAHPLDCLHETQIVAHSLRAEGFDASDDGTANAVLTPNGGRDGMGVGAVAVFQQSSMKGNGTIGYEDSGAAKPCKTEMDGQMLHAGMAVRRLTPEECEALQGFPRGYTRIAWGKKSAEDCPDGPRYKALGNSMAVNVMRFIAERIQIVDEIE